MRHCLTRLGVSLCLMGLWCGVVFHVSPAQAARGKTTITGPGFEFQEKAGWFGRSEQNYKDILGNTHQRKTGWFGRTTQESTLFGNQMTRQGDNLSIRDSKGTPLFVRQKSWLGGEETTIDGDEILQSLLNITQ